MSDNAAETARQERLHRLEERLREIDDLLGRPEVASDHRRVTEIARERTEIQPVVEAARNLARVERSLGESETLLREEKDPELQELARAEVAELGARRDALRQQVAELLRPKDADEEKNTVMEIRAGTGGEEAALFAADLFRLYQHFVEKRGWQTEVLSSSPTGLGGFKEVIFLVQGRGAFRALRFEGGTHRVQRVPATEASGRIHTSAVTVAVLPEAEEVDVAINPTELRIDVYRSSGPGGQSVNTTDSAVRITHLPTGIVVACQDERSQHKNKAKGMKILAARLLDRARQEQDAERSAARRQMLGSGDRSEKIRTYNYPQNRVTDHRIGMSMHNLTGVMEGELDALIDALQARFEEEQLRSA